MKKRVWALLLAVVLAFSVLAGCAKQENTPADSKEPSNQTDPTPSGDDKTDAPAEASQDVFPLAETYNVSAFAFGNTGEELDKTLTMRSWKSARTSTGTSPPPARRSFPKSAA